MSEKNIGSIISRLREEKGLTQKELADKLNISDKAISRWENGVNLPNIDMIYKISTIFKISFQNLLKVRLEDEHVDEKVIKNIMSEFNETNKRKTKLMKIAFYITLVIVLILIITLIFTRTYNKFKVYSIWTENDSVIVSGTYIETRIKDSIILNDIKIKGREIKVTDTISVDIYFIEDNKKQIIYTSSNLSLSFSNYQTYIKINDLSKYIDNLYISVTIIDNKGKMSEYENKLLFAIDFSNNKIYNNELKTDFSITSLDKNVVKDLLLKDGFKELEDSNLLKQTKNYKMTYYYNANKLYYVYEKNNLSYRYIYNFDLLTLEVLVFDENNTEIENYKYSVSKNDVEICLTGSCNDFEYAMEILNENVLNYLYSNS